MTDNRIALNFASQAQLHKLLFVSDFHGTLSQGGHIHEDYFRVLLNMHRTGHDVVIVSGLPDDAQAELNESPVVRRCLEELRDLYESDEAYDLAVNKLKEGFLKVGDKARIVAELKDRGIPMEKIRQVDVFCDDDNPALLSRLHLDPRDVVFDDFLQTAAYDLNSALGELLGADAIETLHNNPKESVSVFRSLEELRSAYPDDFRQLYDFCMGQSSEVRLSEVGLHFCEDAGLITVDSESHESTLNIHLSYVIRRYSPQTDKFPIPDTEIF